MKLDEEKVAAIAASLHRTGAVPLPGGHGVYFKRLRERHPMVAQVPGTVRRCYVGMTLLGDPETEERWNGAAWLPHAAAWFDVHGGGVTGGLDAPRWRYMLAAMFKVIMDWAAVSDERRRLLADVPECERAARARLGALHRRVGSQSALSTDAPSSPGSLYEHRPPKWEVARSELRGSNSARLQMMYFMYTLHSSLGLAQHSLDVPNGIRRVFYGQLKAILDQGGVSSCRLCGAAKRIAGALATTAVLNEAGRKSVHTGMLAAQLPACFQPAHQRSHPQHRDVIEQWLADDPNPRDLLLDAHDLAEAVADLLIDPLRAGRIDVTSFKPSHYGYLLSVVRDGPRRYEAAARANALPPEEPILDTDGPSLPVAMNLSFAKRMAEGRLIEQSQKRLAFVEPAPRWTARLDAERCAICQSETQKKG